MANNVYIGARYVPKFYSNSANPKSMEWEGGVAYEPITVVSYLCDTYTSKIPVPSSVGNPADNPSFWAKTGQYNAAIQSLQETMSEIISSIGQPSILTEDDTINNAIYKSHIKDSNSPRASIFKAFQAFRKTYFDHITGTSGIELTLQAAEYDSKRNVICIGLINTNDETEGFLVTVSANNLNTVSNSRHFTNNELGHCGPMAYDPIRDRFITVKGSDHTKLLTFSAATLQPLDVVDTGIDSGTANLMHGITYDAENDVFYADTFIGVYTLDSTLTVIDYQMFDIDFRTVCTATAAYSGSHAMNGFHYHDGYFYIMLMLNNDRVRIHNIFKIDMNLKVVGVYDVSKTSNSFEFEDITSINDDIFVFGYHDVFTQYILKQSPAVSSNTLEVNNSNGVALPDNAVLGIDAFDTGVYSYRNARSLTISDAPFTGDTTIISRPFEGRQMQIAIGGHYTKPRIVCRTFVATTDTWSDWLPINTEYIVHNTTREISGYFNGFVNVNGKPGIFINNIAFCNDEVRNAATIKFVGDLYMVDGSVVHVAATDTTNVYLKPDCVQFRINTSGTYSSIANTPLVANGVITITTT